MSVHHGDWKLIRTFHYGDNGKHQYRLYNLREDIGEKTNLATSHPKKVEELDKLIEDYIAEADVVVPLPNPKFDSAKFDPAKIGVQPGGLKMPPSFKSSQTKSGAGKPSKPVDDKSMLGWIARNAVVSVARRVAENHSHGPTVVYCQRQSADRRSRPNQASHPASKRWNESAAVASGKPGYLPEGWAKSVVRCRWRGLARAQRSARSE